MRVKAGQHAQRDQSRRHPVNAICVQCGHTAKVARIERAQQIGDFLATAFAQYHPIRSHAQGRLDQLRQSYGSGAFHIRPSHHHRHMVAASEIPQFPNLLNGDDTVQ